MADVIKPLPPRWVDENAKQVFENLEVQRMEVIRRFTIPPEGLGVVPPYALAKAHRQMPEATENLVAQMCELFNRYTVPQVRIRRSCKCSGIVHELGCSENTN